MPYVVDSASGERKWVENDTSPSPAPIDINNPDELRALAKSALVEIVQTAPRNVALVAAIRELLDRVDGKPVQSQQSMVLVAEVAKPLNIDDRAALEHYFKIKGMKNAGLIEQKHEGTTGNS